MEALRGIFRVSFKFHIGTFYKGATRFCRDFLSEYFRENR